MINFRFHLVSLVAVFLALALGVVMGSTVIDRAIVDGLKSRIDRVERNADARRAENLELERTVETLEAYAEQALPLVVGRRLEGITLTMVAVRGVDGDVLRATVEILRDGGATVPGVVWIEPPFALTDEAARVKLRDAVGEPIDQGIDDLRQATIEALGRRLALGPQPPPGAPPPLAGTEDLLAALGAAGFVSFETLGAPDVDVAAYPTAGVPAIVVDGSAAEVDAATTSLPLVRSIAMAGTPVLLGEVFREIPSGPARGDIVRAVREDQNLAARVATVDDLDDIRGRAAAALAVEELRRGRVGHYGQGPGASRQLPELPVPTSSATGS